MSNIRGETVSPTGFISRDGYTNSHGAEVDRPERVGAWLGSIPSAVVLSVGRSLLTDVFNQWLIKVPVDIFKSD